MYSGTTDENGNVNFQVPAGAYYVSATKGDQTGSANINVTSDGQTFTVVLGQTVIEHPDWTLTAAVAGIGAAAIGVAVLTARGNGKKKKKRAR